MAKQVGIGSELEVEFTAAPRGARVTQLVNGRPAYATESGPAPLFGDIWKVKIVAMNPRRTVYFVEPLELVQARDGLTDVLRPFSPFYHEYIREAEAVIADILADVSEVSEVSEVSDLSDVSDDSDDFDLPFVALSPEAAAEEVSAYLNEAILLPAAYRELKLAQLPALLSLQTVKGNIYEHGEQQGACAHS